MKEALNLKSDSYVVYITGRPGFGKYTIAKSLEDYGFITCDNQLMNNPIFELLNYDGYAAIPDYAWDIIRKIREAIFEFLTQERRNSYTLTNNLFEDKGDRELFQRVKQVAHKRGSIFVPVRLLISKDEG